MSNIKIVLANYHDAYNPGQTIIGRLDCYFRSEKKVKRIYVRFSGKANVRWTESESYYDHHEKKHKSRSVTYWGEETYFYNQVELVSSGGDSKIIPAGTYSYNFQYTLPHDLPSTIYGNDYSLSYSIEGVVDRPWKFDIEDSLAFQVFTPIDLNYIQECKNPVKMSDDKTVCCFCCASGPIEITVSLAKSGFAVGEKILLNIYLSNMSNTDVDEVSVKFKEVITYTAQTPHRKSRYDTNLLMSRKTSGVGAHGENNYNLELEVPPSTAIHYFKPCGILQNHYNIEVEAEISGCHSDLELTIPVHMGHIALAHIGVPEIVTRQPAFTEHSVPLTGSTEGDFVFIDHAPPPPVNMPMPQPMFPDASDVKVSMPMPTGMPMPSGPGMPMPPNTGMPMPPNTGMPMPPNTGMPFPSSTSMPMPALPGQGFTYPPSSYPQDDKIGYHIPQHGGGPSAPQPTNPTAPPPPGGESSAPPPPSYDEAMTLPQKQPL